MLITNKIRAESTSQVIYIPEYCSVLGKHQLSGKVYKEEGIHSYRIARNFHGVQFSWIAKLQSFRSLIFADAFDHAHYTYFTGLIFADSRSSAKSTKIGPHENFPLYGMLY
jgi:hypothetical protein